MKKMKCSISCMVFASVLVLGTCPISVSAQDSGVNLAATAKITANSTAPNTKPEFVADGKKTNESRWVSEKKKDEPHFLDIDFGKEQTIRKITLSTGSQQGGGLLYPAADFVFQKWEKDAWVEIPGTKKEGNKDYNVTFEFPQGVKTSKLRFLCNDLVVRVFELSVY